MMRAKNPEGVWGKKPQPILLLGTERNGREKGRAQWYNGKVGGGGGVGVSSETSKGKISEKMKVKGKGRKESRTS